MEILNKNVCIFGLGFVGNAMFNSFKNKGLEENINLFVYDKFKNGGIGSMSDGLLCGIIFLSLPTLYDENSGCYDKSAIHDCCNYLSENNYSGVIVIKSTVEPETTDNLSKTYHNLSFIHNPEFLTARTAYEDFHSQSHIVLGKSVNCPEYKLQVLQEFYLKYYPNVEFSICTSLESESMKIFSNSFYSIKIQFFTELYLLTKSNGSDYNKIVDIMLKNNWINPKHTNVPGPDGQISYGGLCFPKDTNALNKYMEKNNCPNKVIESCICERNDMRDDNYNITKKSNDYDYTKIIDMIYKKNNRINPKHTKVSGLDDQISYDNLCSSKDTNKYIEKNNYPN